MKVYCNPLNLPYKYQHYGPAAHREAADPTLVLFKGKYYLFISMSAGFCVSEDLVNWTFHENRKLDIYRYAPDVRVIDGKLVFSASVKGQNGRLLRTDDPESDIWEEIQEPFDFWDPDIFQDDDGRVYFYFGCGCNEPIRCVELDRKTLQPLYAPKPVIRPHYHTQGYERMDILCEERPPFHNLHENLRALFTTFTKHPSFAPWIEGAFMTKINGKYYLQYACPGTSLATYCDGVYVSDRPDGPFTVQKHNPFSLKAGGFMGAAGHGSTIFDKDGNLWHVATMRISANKNFERRIGLFPAGTDADGILFCNQNYGDWPVRIPDGKFDPMALKPEWMLLSYKKQATASSSTAGHGPEQALNEYVKTSWCAETEQSEYTLDLGRVCRARAVELCFADVDVPLLEDRDVYPNKESKRYIDSQPMFTRWLLEGSTDGESWFTVEDKRETDTDLPDDSLFFEKEALEARYLRLRVTELPYHKKCAISGFRVFGEPYGEAPEAPAGVKAKRKSNGMTAIISWEKAERAIGYNVRFGIAPDKLYSSWQVYEDTEVLIPTLMKKQKDYYFAVDSFGEGGITEGEVRKL